MEIRGLNIPQGGEPEDSPLLERTATGSSQKHAQNWNNIKLSTARTLVYLHPST